MAISQELKKIYADYDNKDMYYQALELQHPNFGFKTPLYPSKTLYPSKSLYPANTPYSTSVYLIQANDNMKFNVDGHDTLFLAYPFGIVPPKAGADEQDLQIVFQNVSHEIIEGIELASKNPEIPIKMRYFIYIDGKTDSQITPIVLTLKNISANMTSIQATAQRSDLYRYTFPTKVFGTEFKGLYL